MQLYEVIVVVRLDEENETSRVIVCAENADKAEAAAAVALKISPTYAEFDVRRIKGNAYIEDQWMQPRKQLNNKDQPVQPVQPKPQEPSSPMMRDAHRVQATTGAAPRKLSKRVIELQATVYARTDRAAYVAVGQAVKEYGKAGSWRSEYVELESCACTEDEQRKPNNPRVVTNAEYKNARLYRN